MKIQTSILIFVVAWALTACSAGSAPTASLENTSWTLTDYGDNALIADTAFTVSFADGQISGWAGCNSYAGDYSLNGGRIEIGMLMTTEMACLQPEGLMEQEQALLAFLGNVERWELNDGQLTFFRSDGVALVFRQDA